MSFQSPERLEIEAETRKQAVSLLRCQACRLPFLLEFANCVPFLASNVVLLGGEQLHIVLPFTCHLMSMCNLFWQTRARPLSTVARFKSVQPSQLSISMMWHSRKRIWQSKFTKQHKATVLQLQIIALELLRQVAEAVPKRGRVRQLVQKHDAWQKRSIAKPWGLSFKSLTNSYIHLYPALHSLQFNMFAKTIHHQTVFWVKANSVVACKSLQTRHSKQT